jgi:2-polyprenyl-3-methyl-5-hydroxy-6-metoxy-1,4-benzoquinol methylase
MKIFCSKCGFTTDIHFQNLSEVKCQCIYTWKVNENNLIIERMDSDLDLSYKGIYNKIAEQDLSLSIQDPGMLNLRAKNDFLNFGELKGLKVLEIGPGRGDLTNLLIESGADVYVADLIPSYLFKFRKSGCRTIEVDAQDLTIVDHFDLVIACDVIEHVFRPADLLISINRSLKYGGLLYLRCPQKESLDTYSNLTGYPYEIVHLRSYTKKLLKNEIMNSGFTIKSVFQIKAAAPYLRSFAFRVNFNVRNKIGVFKIVSFNRFGVKFVNLCLGQYDPNKNKARKMTKPVLKVIRLLFTHSSEIAILGKKI